MLQCVMLARIFVPFFCACAYHCGREMWLCFQNWARLVWIDDVMFGEFAWDWFWDKRQFETVICPCVKKWNCHLSQNMFWNCLLSFALPSVITRSKVMQIQLFWYWIGTVGHPMENCLEHQSARARTHSLVLVHYPSRWQALFYDDFFRTLPGISWSVLFQL